MLIAVLLAAAPASLTVAEARRSLIGRWDGTLEYRDYQADRWFGLPVKVAISDGGDGVTLIRVADFDDGPATGTVRITTIGMFDPATGHETSASFRKGRAVELQDAALELKAGARADEWAMVETIAGRDDERPATIRLTTTRAGGKLVTLKEVDFTDDAKQEWLVRNRTTLTRQ